MYALLDQARHPVVPTQSDALIAREALPRLKLIAEAGADVHIRLLESADVIVPLPAVAVQVIVGLLEAIAEGRPVSVIPSDAELTTQQAADMLNVSRPHLVKLLDEGRIPFGRVGTHRRVKVADLMAYKGQAVAQSQAAIDDMVALSQELGLE